MAAITVEGTVSHHFTKGYRVQEAGDYGNRFTCWSEERPPIGTPVTVTGKLGVKVTERDGKHYTDLSINFPTIQPQTGAQAPTAPTGQYTATGTDNWGDVNADAPF